MHVHNDQEMGVLQLDHHDTIVAIAEKIKVTYVSAEIAADY